LLQIDREIGIVAEHAQLTLSLETHAACRDVGDAPSSKTNTRIGDIDGTRKYRRADSVDRLDGTADDTLHNVDIVNHQIKDNVDVGSSLFERRETLTFDEARPLEPPLGGDDRGIEALEMPHLQDAPLPRRQRDEVSCLLGRLGDGLFDEHMCAGFEKITRDGVMCGRRRHDAYRIDLTEQLAVIGDASGVELSRERLARLRSRVGDRDQGTGRLTGVLLRMEPAEITAPITAARMVLMPYYARMGRRNSKLDLLTVNREARLLAGSIIFSAVGLPLIVWATGRALLGPYANGGMFAILGDFFTLLYAGSFSAWILLFAPYALLSALRLTAWGVRQL